MTFLKSKKRWLIISGIIVLVFIILLISLNSILSNKADSFLREKLSGIDTTSYQIDFKKISVNVFSRTLKIYNISVKPSRSALEEVKSNPLASPVVEVSISRIKIGNISIMKAIKGEDFNIGSLVLSQPDITVFSPQGMFQHKEASNSKTSIFSSDTVVESPVKEATLGTFEIRDATLRWMDMSKEEVVLETRKLNIVADDIWLHQPEGDTLSHVLDLDDISISLQSHIMKLPGDLYTMQTGQIGISYKDKQISLDSLRLIPAYSKGRFGQVVGKQTDRFNITAGNIMIAGIEFDSLLNKNVLIEKIQASTIIADIYRDKRIPRDMSQFPKLFQTAVAGIPMSIDIKEVNITNSYVKYQEIVEESTVAGHVILDQMEIKIKGINNDPDLIRNGITAEVNGMLMNKTPLKLFFHLPVGDPEEFFTFHGTTGSFPATLLNPMIEPLAFIAVTEGTVNSSKFYGIAKRDTAVGRIEFLYQDMKVTVLKKTKESQKAKGENKFLSFLAKTALQKNNPNKGKPIRIGKMYFVRDPNKGFFNFVWKSIQNGLLNSMSPFKKDQAKDIGWGAFEADWENILQKDWTKLNTKEEKKNRKKGK